MGVDITDPKTWKSAKRKRKPKRTSKTLSKKAARLAGEFKPQRDKSVYGSGTWGGDITKPKTWKKGKR